MTVFYVLSREIILMKGIAAWRCDFFLRRLPSPFEYFPSYNSDHFVQILVALSLYRKKQHTNLLS